MRNSDCTQCRQEILQQRKDAAQNETSTIPNGCWSLACATHLSKNLWSKNLNDRRQWGEHLKTHGSIEGGKILSREINRKKGYHSLLHLKRHLEYNVIHAMFSDHISNTILYFVILSNVIHASEILTHKLLSTCTSGYIWGHTLNSTHCRENAIIIANYLQVVIWVLLIKPVGSQ